LSLQVNQLKEIICGLCHALVQDEQEKSRILQQMNAIGTINVERDYGQDNAVQKAAPTIDRQSGTFECYDNWRDINTSNSIAKRVKRNE